MAVTLFKPVRGQMMLLRAFGLLFVSVALFLIFFPVFSRAQISKGPSGMSHLRNASAAHLIYASAHEDRFAPPDRWMDALGGSPSKTLFRNPVTRADDSLALNASLGTIPSSLVQSPDATVLHFWTTSPSWNARGGPEHIWLDRRGRYQLATVNGSCHLVQPQNLARWKWRPR